MCKEAPDVSDEFLIVYDLLLEQHDNDGCETCKNVNKE